MSTKSKFEQQMGFDMSFSDEKIDYDNHNPRQIHYGRVTRRGHAMVPLPGVPFRPVTEEDSSVVALDFVTSAFKDLNEKYNSMGLNIFQSDGNGNLTPWKAYEDPISLYREYMRSVLGEFVKKDLLVDNDNVMIYKFSDFMRRFINYISRRPKFPYLFSSYVKSSICPPHVSGLVIELDRVSHNSMEDKYEYSTNVEVNNFISLAKRYGFVVPKQSPWCLVANLNSSIMFNYAVEYDIPSKERLIPSYYIECRSYDIDLVKDRIIESYMNFLQETETRLKKSLCEDKGLVGRVQVLNMPTVDPTISYKPEDWIRLYFQIMSIEKKSKVSQILFDSIMRDCYYMINRYDFETMHDYALSKLNFKETDKYR